ncbi:putative serine/threonine-protein kinase [Smittium mucronatum]|uniref:Putative serine/threonine-protein kinase n=1 Tax=Smittium mucronatum TaxID=133383 RepID=A0A1R0H1Y0_9FUNG|nr:putative serine/threonine-protein kinase [Smittium mucronatum]
MLLTSEDILKISDFGASRIIHKDTVINQNQGTPAFMSPELYTSQADKVDDFAADVWALGASLYCMVFGRIPFHGESINDISKHVINDPIEFPTGTDQLLIDLLKKMLEKDPSQRASFEDIRVKF